MKKNNVSPVGFDLGTYGMQNKTSATEPERQTFINATVTCFILRDHIFTSLKHLKSENKGGALKNAFFQYSFVEFKFSYFYGPY